MRAVSYACGAAAALSLMTCGGSSPTTPTPPTPACSFQLTASLHSFGPDAATAAVTVSTSSQCAWSARVEAGWISITSGASGIGSGTVALAIASNDAAAARETSVIVADQSVRLTQQGRTRCEFALSSDLERMGHTGGQGSVELSTGVACAWTARSSDPWVTVSPEQGVGSTTLRYTVAHWTGTTDREASIEIADRRLTIRQGWDRGGCQYSVVPVELILHWHHQGGEIQLSTTAGCPWTVRSAGDWLVPEPTSGEGDVILRFSTSIYTSDGSRRAPLEIRWPTATEGQNVWVTQEGCRYGLDTTPVTFPAEGGTARIDVWTQAVSPSCALDCPWTAESSVPWIRILSGSRSAGDNPVRYEVLPNPGPAIRVGVITVAARTLTITQLP